MFIINWFVSKEVNDTYVQIACLSLAMLSEQERVFSAPDQTSEWFPVEKMQTFVMLSSSGCSRSGWSLWEASGSGQSEVIYFLSAVAHVRWKSADWLWSTQQNIQRSNVRITACSPCSIRPHTLTPIKPLCVFVWCNMGDLFSIDSVWFIPLSCCAFIISISSYSAM